MWDFSLGYSSQVCHKRGSDNCNHPLFRGAKGAGGLGAVVNEKGVHGEGKWKLIYCATTTVLDSMSTRCLPKEKAVVMEEMHELSNLLHPGTLLESSATKNSNLRCRKAADGPCWAHAPILILRGEKPALATQGAQRQRHHLCSSELLPPQSR